MRLNGAPARGKRAGTHEAEAAKSQPQSKYSTPRGKAQGPGQVVYNAQGRAVGRIERGWLVKRNLDPERHMLHSPPGWCTDAAHLELSILGIRLYTVTGEVWEARLELWRRYGQPLDRAWGAQVLLPAKYWHVEHKRARQLKLFAEAGM